MRNQNGKLQYRVPQQTSDLEGWRKTLNELDDDFRLAYAEIFSEGSSDLEVVFEKLLSFVEILISKSDQKSILCRSLLAQLEKYRSENTSLKSSLRESSAELSLLRRDITAIIKELEQSRAKQKRQEPILAPHIDENEQNTRSSPPEGDKSSGLPFLANLSTHIDKIEDPEQINKILNIVRDEIEKRDREIFLARKSANELLVLLTDLWHRSCSSDSAQAGANMIMRPPETEPGMEDKEIEHESKTKVRSAPSVGDTLAALKIKPKLDQSND